VATPSWTVRVLTPNGLLKPFGAEVNRDLFAQYFPDPLEEDSS